MSNKKSVFAIYSGTAEAERAADTLVKNGFSASDISVLLPESLGTRDLGTEKNTKGPEGTATGATVGGAIGGALGLLEAFGAIAIPGVGPLLAAGPVVAALAGVGAGGVAGGIVGGLVGLGIPEFEAKRYQGLLRNGGILLAVHADTSEDRDRAKKLLEGTSGQHVTVASEEPVSSQERSRGATGGN